MPTIADPLIKPYGDFALYLRYSCEGYSAPINDRILALAEYLRQNGNWIDVVAAYETLVASFDPSKLSLAEAQKQLSGAVQAVKKADHRRSKPASQTIVDIPVYYGGSSGPDIENIMSKSGLSHDGVIAMHCGPVYRVCMMGFVPGFTFLSEAPSALHHPRHVQPRLSVPSGSIGIAGWQTGIYGLSSPGGWQIIGRTPLSIFDAAREAPFMLKAGDNVRFVPQNGPFPERGPSHEAGQ